jgi:hypothetical protein
MNKRGMFFHGYVCRESGSPADVIFIYIKIIGQGEIYIKMCILNNITDKKGSNCETERCRNEESFHSVQCMFCTVSTVKLMETLLK